MAEDLFEEWSDELDEYDSSDLRDRSSELLRDTRARYERMIVAMNEAIAEANAFIQTLE